MMRRRSWIAWGFAAACAAFAGFWVARQVDSAPLQLASGTWFPQRRSIGPVALTAASGKPFTERDLTGHPTLVFFGFTHCPEVCPTTLARLAEIKKSAALPGLRVLFVSVDPERDTPVVIAPYVRAFDPEFIGATGTSAEIGRLTQRFGVAVARIDLPGGDYMMDHSAAVFLIDTHARIVAVFTPPFDAPPFAADLRHAASRLGG